MKMRPGTWLSVVFFILLSLGVYFNFNRIAILIFSKAQNIDISYRKIASRKIGEAEFSDLDVRDNKRGISVFSKHGLVSFRLAALGIGVDFDFRDVRFARTGQKTEESYTSLSGLVSVPFAGKWTYEEIKGNLRISSEGTRVNSLWAAADDIKLSLKGMLSNDNKIDGHMTIYFSPVLTTKIPDALGQIILREEDRGWKSLAVWLKGDFGAPSIQISSEHFRLNIKSL